MGETFLRGYCRLAEGEKDPRNLKLAFAIDRVLLIEFELPEPPPEPEPVAKPSEEKDDAMVVDTITPPSNIVEDLFDITFCYFPINFTPPKDDPYGITSEELQIALRWVHLSLLSTRLICVIGIHYRQHQPSADSLYL